MKKYAVRYDGANIYIVIDIIRYDTVQVRYRAVGGGQLQYCTSTCTGLYYVRIRFGSVAGRIGTLTHYCYRYLYSILQ